jgi:hypothetical protein
MEDILEFRVLQKGFKLLEKSLGLFNQVNFFRSEIV